MSGRQSFEIRGATIELDESEAQDLIIEIQARFGWIGTTITPDDVNGIVGYELSDDDWVQLQEDLNDDVLRLVESLG